MLRQNHLAGQLHQSVHVWLEPSKVIAHADQVEVMDNHKIAWKGFFHSESKLLNRPQTIHGRDHHLGGVGSQSHPHKPICVEHWVARLYFGTYKWQEFLWAIC